MSKTAYLVFAYKNPQLLKRAIKMLSTEHCAFFVHIDQKSDIDQFSCISGDNVFFTDKRLIVYWAEFLELRQFSCSYVRHLTDPSDLRVSCFSAEASIP